LGYRGWGRVRVRGRGRCRGGGRGRGRGSVGLRGRVRGTACHAHSASRREHGAPGVIGVKG
jgi:hypothetical protein